MMVRMFHHVIVLFTEHYLHLFKLIFSSCRDDSNPMCMSGHIPGRSFGEEAQPFCSGSYQDGHAGEPGVHSLLRVIPVPGMWHRTCGRGYCSLWKQVSPRSFRVSPPAGQQKANLTQPCQQKCHVIVLHEQPSGSAGPQATIWRKQLN